MKIEVHASVIPADTGSMPKHGRLVFSRERPGDLLDASLIWDEPHDEQKVNFVISRQDLVKALTALKP